MPEWSKYQKDIFQWVATSRGNLTVKAVAGSGKTSTAIESLRYLPFSKTATMLAFNKDIAENLKTKLPTGHSASTYNAFGYGIARRALGNKCRFDQYKTKGILESLLPGQKFLHYPAGRLVDLVKANLSDTSDNELDFLSSVYNIEIESDYTRFVFETVRKTIKKGLEMDNVLDFSDQMYHPVMFGWKSEPMDFVIVDELQDTNPAQLAMIQNCMITDRVMGIGDPAQSIYAFRGADIDAMDKITLALQAMVLPLSVSYRAPLAVVELVNRNFPEIAFEASPFAIEGSVSNMSEKDFLQNVKSGDMVLCRVNAPMVKHCLRLIQKGVKATIKGRDIGQGLIALIRRMKTDSVSELFRKLDTYKTQEIEKAMAFDNFQKVQQIEDKVATIVAIADGLSSTYELTTKIESIFSDNTPGITFSTVHKAKGLEAETVYIIEPQLMPHPKARQPRDRQQEINIMYVAQTRALKNLIFVGDK